MNPFNNLFPHPNTTYFAMFQGESPENYEQKCLCVLALDISGSMQGQAIAELNKGLQAFQKEVVDDFVASQRLEISIVTFGSTAQCIQQPVLVGQTEIPTLQAAGTTKLVSGVQKALEIVEQRKQWYKETGQNYYRPMVVLITDGEPDPDQDLPALAREITQGMVGKKFTFFALGVKGFNYDKLAQLCPPPTHPLVLDGYKFANFFRWLSNSIGIGIIKSAERGEKPKLLPPGDYGFLEQIEF
jgi:uncharacterized protein YegL